MFNYYTDNRSQPPQPEAVTPDWDKFFYEHEVSLFHCGFETPEESEAMAWVNTENEAALPGHLIY